MHPRGLRDTEVVRRLNRRGKASSVGGGRCMAAGVASSCDRPDTEDGHDIEDIGRVAAAAARGGGGDEDS